MVCWKYLESIKCPRKGCQKVPWRIPSDPRHPVPPVEVRYLDPKKHTWKSTEPQEAWLVGCLVGALFLRWKNHGTWNANFTKKRGKKGMLFLLPRTQGGGGFGREEILNVHCSACGKRLYFAQTNRWLFFLWAFCVNQQFCLAVSWTVVYPTVLRYIGYRCENIFFLGRVNLQSLHHRSIRVFHNGARVFPTMAMEKHHFP